MLSVKFNVILCTPQLSCFCCERAFVYNVDICCNFCEVILFCFFYEKAKIVRVDVVLLAVENYKSTENASPPARDGLSHRGRRIPT